MARAAVEALEIRSRSSSASPTPWSFTAILTIRRFCSALISIGERRRGIFRGILDQLTERPLDQHWIDLEQRKVVRDGNIEPMPASSLRFALDRSVDDVVRDRPIRRAAGCPRC